MAKIKKDTNLRKAILQAAITGKLKVDNEKLKIEETGKQLLDRIIEERNAKLLADWEEAKKKNPKAKKPAPIVASKIEEDEIPFEIPESWCWCRLGDVAFIARGGSPRPINEYLTNDSDGYNWIKISDTDKGGKYINSTKQRIKKEGLYKTRLIHKGDFLLTNSMSFGRPYISNIEGCIHDGWLVFSFPNNCIISDFIYYLLSSSFIYKQFADSAAGAVVQNLNTDKVIETIIPLPPLAVQNAIVAKLEEVLPLVDVYENAVLQKEELKTALPDKVKKAILQEAIQGKLTEEWRKTAIIEETGKQLLDRIIEERKKMSHGLDFANAKSGKRKSKKETALAGSNPCDIPEDEIPFEIPESWCWCRIEDITTFIGGKNNQIQAKEILKEGKIPVVSQGQSLIDGYSNETQKVINNIPVIMFGDHTRNVKYIDFPFVIGADGTKFLKPILCNEKYIYYLVYFIAQNLRNRGYARHYSLLKEEYLPLPPLDEQKKIVEILEQMLPLCEKLGG